MQPLGSKWAYDTLLRIEHLDLLFFRLLQQLLDSRLFALHLHAHLLLGTQKNMSLNNSKGMLAVFMLITLFELRQMCDL